MALDLEFIEYAEKRTSFNFEAKHFLSVDYKPEIQHLFKKYFFPDFDLSKTVNVVDKDSLNNITDELKSYCRTRYSYLHDYKLNGVGPGEVALFFKVNSAILGGGSSAGIDLTDDKDQYEIKAIDLFQDKFAVNFRLGGSVNTNNISSKLNELREELELPGDINNINKGTIAQIYEKCPKEFDILEEEFKEEAYKYFYGHKVIFINNGRVNKSKIGKIEAVTYIQRDSIFLERVTNGELKPMVKLNG